MWHGNVMGRQRLQVHTHTHARAHTYHSDHSIDLAVIHREGWVCIYELREPILAHTLWKAFIECVGWSQLRHFTGSNRPITWRCSAPLLFMWVLTESFFHSNNSRAVKGRKGKEEKKVKGWGGGGGRAENTWILQGDSHSKQNNFLQLYPRVLKKKKKKKLLEKRQNVLSHPLSYEGHAEIGLFCSDPLKELRTIQGSSWKPRSLSPRR